MAIRKGLPAKLAATDANDTRYDFRNLVVCNSDGSPRGGVTSPVGSNIVTATATMNVSVAAFSAFAVRDGGVVLLANDGPVNVLLAAAPAANSRIDVVYAKQNDSSSTVNTPDANDTPVIGVVQGTSSASPVKPAIPVGAVELATVQVPAGATATNSGGVVITQTAQFTAAPGGVVPFRTVSDLTLWTTAGPRQRASVFADSTTTNNDDYVNVSGTWTRSRVVGGLATLTTDASGLGSITHGLGATPSRVNFTPVYTNNTVSAVFRPTVGAVTGTTIQLVAFRTDSSGRLASTAVQFYWEAWL